MCEMNYFIKLLMLSISDNDFVLLYGFSCTTNQEIYNWKENVDSKNNRYIYRAILNEDRCKSFFKNLTEPVKIYLNSNSFTSPQLIKRNIVLSNDDSNEKIGPIKKYRQLTEFWNTNKRDLYNKIIQELEVHGIEGKELYTSITDLFSWVSKECGVNIMTEGYKLGNFEFYHPLKNELNFKIEPHKECNLLKTTVKKMCNFNNKLIVNCSSKYRNRTISNQTKMFLPEEQEIEFTAKEPMAQVAVQIWDNKSGELIFSDGDTFSMNISFDMNINAPSKMVIDPWSKKLIKSASNKKELIENKIQKVTHLNLINTFTVDGGFDNDIDVAIEDGFRIFSFYNKSYEKGAFIKNESKDGEIQSFIKILEYINHSSVKNVIIADPFFSITAASKILARIPNRDIQIEVITSLCEINPDNGKVERLSQSQKFQEFLENNAHILHPKLLVWNLKRGVKQVFHDRYLIRYHENGKIDGFLLSNSLNSMGQFYPFVIAPMDHDVCLEVIEYFNEIRDSDVQKKKNKKERIISDILYDSKKFCNSQEEEISEELPYMDWFAKWKNAESSIRIPEEDIPEAITIVMKSWDNNANLACKMLCYIGAVVESDSEFDLVTKIIKKNEGLVNSFVEEFILLAEEAELKRTHYENGVESEEYRIFLLLEGNAQPSRSGFSTILKKASHIWYGPIWLSAGYDVLLDLTPERYIELLEKTKSPLMFGVLLYQLSFHSSLNEMFPLFIEKGNLCVQLVCMDYILERIESEVFSFEKCKEIIISVSGDKCLIPVIYLISKISSYDCMSLHIDHDKWREFLYWLMDIAAKELMHVSEEIQNNVIYWLHDSDVISKCKLHFNLAKIVSDSSLKKRLLENALKVVEEDLFKYSYCIDIEQIGILYIKLLIELYGDSVERKLFRRYIDWSAFETATEPGLKNYNYDKWFKAVVRAVHQLQILYIYQQIYFDSCRVKESIEFWGKRIFLNDIKNEVGEELYEKLRKQLTLIKCT